MKKLLQLKALPVAAVMLFISFCASAQENKPLASPADSISGKVGNANITIKYGSPSVRERKIWGSLVPYGQVWRAGANKATTFTTDKAIKVEGKQLAAGTYSLFTVPTEGEWTIVFNKTADQWGAYKYDQKEDALRVTVKPIKAAAMNERLTYALNNNGFTLNWENLTVPVTVK